MSNSLYNKEEALEMAERIENYHHKRGDRHVKAWVETDVFRERRVYFVRSNIKYYTPK